MSGSLASKHILVVEDDNDLRELMVDMLSQYAAKVSEASNGRNAFKLITDDQTIVIVVSDIRMPGGDGVELMKELFNMNRAVKPALFLVSGFSDLSEAEAQRFGVVKLLAKPFDANHLIALLEKTASTL